MDSPQGPSSVFRGVASATQDELEDWQDAQEEAADLGRKAGREASRSNKVASFLGQKFWRTGKTWPFLYWRVGGWQSRVELYFPTINLAVDRYRRPTSMDRQEAAFKAQALKANGIKYVALFPENKLKELSRYI